MRTPLIPLVCALCLAGCATASPGPATTPASEHAAYATTYPAEVRTASSQYEAEVTSIQRLKRDLKSFPDALSEPDWELVLEVYQAADEDGRSAHFSQVVEDNATIARFFVEEEKELVGRTTASVNYQAKGKGCDVQLYGAVDHGLEKALEERLEERRERASSAQKKLLDQDAAKGDKNLETLKEQATKLTLLSHLVGVALPERHSQLERLVSEASAVKRTLKKRREELEEAPEPESKALKKSRQEELEAIKEAETSLDEDVQTAETLLALSEQQIDGMRESYEDEFHELISEVRKRAGKKADEAEDTDQAEDTQREDAEKDGASDGG